MLTGRNEWVAIAVLIVYIAFIPCPGFMTVFFSSSIGKMVALGVIVYVLKYVSIPVAILMLVAVDRKGALREYLEEETGMSPTTAATAAVSTNDYTCPSEYTYDATEMMCKKGNETKNPTCNNPSMTWDSMVGKCVSKPTTDAGGPPGGTTPGQMQANNDMMNAAASTSTLPPTTEPFVPYGGKKNDNFASL